MFNRKTGESFIVNFLVNNWATLLDAASRGSNSRRGSRHLGCILRNTDIPSNWLKRMNGGLRLNLLRAKCARFGNEILKQVQELRTKIEKSGCEYLKHSKLIKEGDQVRLDSSVVTEIDREKIKEHSSEIMCVINSLEGFAIPFASNVADNGVGFVECGRSFVAIFEYAFPVILPFKFAALLQIEPNDLLALAKTNGKTRKLERQHAEAEKNFSYSLKN